MAVAKSTKNAMAGKYCTIFLVRHGQTDWNLESRIQGRKPIPINKTGKKQANTLAQYLGTKKVAAVYSPDILRTYETAEIISAQHKLRVNTTKLLRERVYGPLIGKNQNEYSRKIRQILDKYFAIKDVEKRWRHRPLRGHESCLDVEVRVLRFLREVAVAFPGQPVVAVTHGGVIKIVLAALGWVSRDEFYKVRVNNTGFVAIKSDGVDFSVEEINNIERNGAK